MCQAKYWRYSNHPNWCGKKVFWTGAQKVYEACRDIGLCRSQRDFSRRLLGRGPHYLRLVSNRKGFVSEKTTRVLKSRLAACPEQGIAADQVAAILRRIDEAVSLGRWLRRA